MPSYFAELRVGSPAGVWSSLPFSDHCEPLVDSKEDQRVLTAALDREVEDQPWSYLEIRPLEPFEIITPLAHTAVTYDFPSARS